MEHEDFYGVQKFVDENGGVEKFRCFAIMDRFEIITPFGIGLTSNRNSTWVECRIDESRYKIQDGYKITLVPLDPMYGSEHYYQSDFMSLVDRGLIIVKTNDNQVVEHVTWNEPICGNVVVQHEGDIIVDVPESEVL